MTAEEIITLFRRDVDDEAAPFLWSEEEALDYLNDAILEACRRSRLLVDSSTAAVCQITIPTTGIVTLDPRVLFVRKVRIAGRVPMRRMNMQDMEGNYPQWEDAGASTYPDFFIPDWETGKLRFHPVPSAQQTALLTVVRDPLADIADVQDEPEIAPRYHRSLRHWMAHRAYLKPDEETYKPSEAARALALFEQEFGAKSSAIDEAWLQREQFDGDGSFA